MNINQHALRGLASIIGSADDVRTMPSMAPTNYTDAKTVTAVQAALVKRGYDLGTTGPSGDGVDGDFGPHTKTAIKKLQKNAGLDQTGIIDTQVLQALGNITPGVLPPGVTAKGRAAVQSEAALEAATLAEHSVTPVDVQAAAKAVDDAAPPAPPELVQVVKQAKAAAAVATTPAQVQAAAVQVKDAAMQVHQAVAESWWTTPLWSGAPVRRWHALVGGSVTVALSGILIPMFRRKK